jgi:TPR repeat protein
MEEYEEAQKFKGDFSKYIVKLTEAADKGYEKAIQELENEYNNKNNIVTQNYKVTLKIYEKEIGPYSKFAIGYYYQVYKPDFKKALSIYLELSEKNFGMAINAVGYMYLFGKGVYKNYDTALKYFRMSKYCYNNLGYMYQKGFGVEMNLDTAIKYYKLAIADNNRNGIGNLVEVYRNYKPNDEEIIQYFISINAKDQLKKIFSHDYLLDMVMSLKKENTEMKNHILASPDGELYFEALNSWKKKIKN